MSKGEEEIEGIKTVDDLRKLGINEDKIYCFFEKWVEAIYGIKDNKIFVQMFFNCLSKKGEEAFCKDLRSYMLDNYKKLLGEGKK